MRSDDGETKTFNFRGLMKSPTPLLFTLVAAFARRCGPLGGWRRIASAENGDAVLRRFVRYLAKMHPEVTTIDSVTPEIWQAWRGMLDAGSRYPSQVATSRGLLRDADGLRPDTRLALMERLPRPPRRKTVSYSRGEFARIWKAARRVFRVARRRIAANAELLQRYRDGNEPEDCLRFRLDGEEWTPGRILDHLSRTGRMPPSYKRLTREQGRALRDALGISANSRRSRHALFPAPHEIYAVMILLTCERAFNVSTLANLRVSEADIKAARESRRGPVRTETDKPRRGPRRYSGLTLVGREATLWGRAVNLTQHARDTSAQLGNKVDRLLVGCVRGGRAAGPDGVFITNFGKPLSAVGAWHNATTVAGDNGKTLRVSLERLRLSEQVINGVSRQNTPSVSESTYRLPDPRTVDLARPVMLQGQWSALDHAGQRVAKLMTKDQLAEALADPRHFALMFNISEERAVEVLEELPEGGVDTPTCACADFLHSPHPGDAGGPCTATFLMCIRCPLGIITEAHLPRLLALREALVAAARSSSSEVREKYYREHVVALDDALRQFSPAEVERRHAEVDPDVVEEITRLLNGGFDT